MVLRDLNEVIGLTDDEIAFITDEAVKSASGYSLGESIAEQIDHIEKQLANSDKMIERLYRDNVAGNITDEQLDNMMKKFSGEAKELKERLSFLQNSEASEARVRGAYDSFFSLAKRYKHIEELDRDVLHTFIDRIEVEEKILPEGCTVARSKTPYTQHIRIFYRFIGENVEGYSRNADKVVNF